MAYWVEWPLVTARASTPPSPQPATESKEAAPFLPPGSNGTAQGSREEPTGGEHNLNSPSTRLPPRSRIQHAGAWQVGLVREQIALHGGGTPRSGSRKW